MIQETCETERTTYRVTGCLASKNEMQVRIHLIFFIMMVAGKSAADWRW